MSSTLTTNPTARLLLTTIATAIPLYTLSIYHQPPTILYDFAMNIVTDNIYSPDSDIRANNITCDNITAKSIVANNLVADNVNADLIDVNTLTADNVRARFIKAAAITADVIDADEIQCSGAITCDVLRASSWTGKVVADRTEKRRWAGR